MADPETDVDVGDDAEDPGGNASEEVIPGVLGGVGKASLETEDEIKITIMNPSLHTMHT